MALSWTQSNPTGGSYRFKYVSIQSDGKAVVANDAGRLWYYDGSSWSEQRPDGIDSDRRWSGVSIDGGKILACSDSFTAGSGRVWLYSGGSWSEVQPNGSSAQRWNGCSISGSKMLVWQNSGGTGKVYLYNGSWSETQPAGATTKNWYTGGISGDNIIMGVYNGRLYYYNGSSWAEQQPAGEVDKVWVCAISGSNAIAGIGGGTSSTGKVYYYNGSSWADTGLATTDWYSVSISGNRMIAGISSGRVWENNGVSWAETFPAGVGTNAYWIVARSGFKSIAQNLNTNTYLGQVPAQTTGLSTTIGLSTITF